MRKANATVGRLAPSPTGGLHLGHARTFLIAWLQIRSQGGRLLLRVEDLDMSRVRPEARTALEDDLRWLGFDWDVGPIVQTERLSVYAEALNALRKLERVYPCTCTRADILRASSAPHAEDEGAPYPGTCASKTASDAEGLHAEGKRFAWRFRMGMQTVSWEDRIVGVVTRSGDRLGGDFVVGRSTGEPAYQLAVVCDDASLGVTEVLRGDDLIPSTPRQLALYQALGLTPPQFGHVPLVLGPDGRRLAKRDGSVKLGTLRSDGVDPRWVIGWLAKSCGWSDTVIPSAPADWLSAFSLERIPRTPWLCDASVLDALHRGVDRGLREP